MCICLNIYKMNRLGLNIYNLIRLGQNIYNPTKLGLTHLYSDKVRFKNL